LRETNVGTACDHAAGGHRIIVVCGSAVAVVENDPVLRQVLAGGRDHLDGLAHVGARVVVMDLVDEHLGLGGARQKHG
jgi:hypothetical protein